jgi:ATP-dependent Lon protease
MSQDLQEKLVALLNHLDGNQFSDIDSFQNTDRYPVLAVRDQVVLPHTVTPLFIGRDRSVQAVENAFSQNRIMVAVAQRDPGVENPGYEDLHKVGTEIEVARVLRLPDGTTSALVQGRKRIIIEELIQSEPFMIVRVSHPDEPKVTGPGVEALMRAVLALFERCARLNNTIPEETFVFAMNINEPSWLADTVASSINLKPQEHQGLLEQFNPEARLKMLSILLARELDVLELEDRIHSQLQQELDHSQREYFLREQMRVIQSELGEADVYTQEINELRQKVTESDLPKKARTRALREIERLSAMPPLSPETGIIRTYLDWLLHLPWTEATEDNLDIKQAEQELETSHYGLQEAKDRILEHIAVRRLAADKMRSPILCFAGPPGTGKTSLGRSIAQALGRNFVRVSLGGIRDEAEIRGHRRTYIGALPGRMIQTMRQAKTTNPLFMLDEIDKIGADFRGDPSAALLEALDPEHNSTFSDHYLELPYDLSQVMFVTTANMLDPIPPALQDRMEVIEFSGYIEEEKIEIARRFLIPKQLEQHGLAERQIQLTTGVLQSIIREYTYEAGVRNLEREIAKICRKLARRIAEGKPLPSRITARSLPRLLGPPKFEAWKGLQQDEIGVATGVAWTQAGGDLMPIEVILLEGKGSVTLTGQLGEVMQESAQAALSFARSYMDARSTDDDALDFDKLDVHIHAPEGAIPKDGPSAGITIATALISALLEQPVRRDVVMTGEITLRGRVLAVGGLKEKVMTAHRTGISTFILPNVNKKDLADIPSKVKRDMDFVFVEAMADVLAQALRPTDEQADERRGRGE